MRVPKVDNTFKTYAQIMLIVESRSWLYSVPIFLSVKIFYNKTLG